jgi:hypothetical protein
LFSLSIRSYAPFLKLTKFRSGGKIIAWAKPSDRPAPTAGPISSWRCLPAAKDSARSSAWIANGQTPSNPAMRSSGFRANSSHLSETPRYWAVSTQWPNLNWSRCSLLTSGDPNPVVVCARKEAANGRSMERTSTLLALLRYRRCHPVTDPRGQYANRRYNLG